MKSSQKISAQKLNYGDADELLFFLSSILFLSHLKAILRGLLGNNYFYYMNFDAERVSKYESI